MAQSYISLKKSSPVIMGYICSGCGFPIITIATINTDATQYYSFSQTKAQETAELECDKAIQFEINRIKNCISNQEPLSVDINTVSGWHYGSSCKSSIKDILTPCPNCFNIEKWQKENGHSSSPENYPTIFDNIELAENWARVIIKNLMQEIDNKRSDDNLVNSAKQRTIKLSAYNKNLEQQLLQIPELSEKSKIEQEKNKATSQQKNLAIFDFKGKKVLKLKIKSFDEKLKELKQTISKKETEPRRLIQNNKLELQKVQPIAYGYANEIIINQFYKTLVYLISPNDIPDEQASSVKYDLYNETITTEEIKDTPQIQFCKKCGFKLLPDSDFCSNCGDEIGKDIL